MDITYFLLIYALTIVLTRLCLWIWPSHTGKIVGFQPHHYMFGLVLMVLYLFMSKITLLAVGVGLLVDEIPLFFMFKGWDWPDDHWKQYHSRQSILAIVAISLVGYLVFKLMTS
ncbi:MAG: hypothetical protein Q7R93_04390 [bacterium]|nr:hypothetical protein [bacterium]